MAESTFQMSYLEYMYIYTYISYCYIAPISSLDPRYSLWQSFTEVSGLLLVVYVRYT